MDIPYQIFAKIISRLIEYLISTEYTTISKIDHIYFRDHIYFSLHILHILHMLLLNLVDIGRLLVFSGVV